MSFTSHDLRGWIHIFTSLPLVHTSSPDFWGYVFDLASSWFPIASFMKIFTYHDSRTSQVSDRVTSQVRELRPSQVPDSITSQVREPRASQVPDSRIQRELYILKQVEKFEHKGLARPLLSCFWFKDLWNTRNILRFLRTTTLANLFHEFRQSDVSRVRGFYQVPQQFIICHTNSNEHKMYIKIVALEVIYNFVVEKFFDQNCLGSPNIIVWL
jgi:hypothetical protein